ncbi:MAG: RNA polymerase sigma factor [Nitrospiria bacterium]
MNDLEIISRCVRGDQLAWEEFIKIYGSLAQKILRRYFSLGIQDIENVTQNVFIKLHDGGLIRFRGITPFEFRAYYKTIVLNEAKSYLRGENRWKNKIEDLFLFPDNACEISESENGIEKIKDPYPQPDTETERKQAIKIVDRILENFSLKDRQIFLLKLKGCRENEISNLLEIPMGSVASSYSRMVEKIKTELKKNGID